jgi:hypothetical protein
MISNDYLTCEMFNPRYFYLGICSIYTLEECIFGFNWIEYSINVNLVRLVDSTFQLLYSFDDFLSSCPINFWKKNDFSYNWESISPIRSINFYFTLLKLCCGIHIYLRILYPLSELIFYHKILSPFILHYKKFLLHYYIYIKFQKMQTNAQWQKAPQWLLGMGDSRRALGGLTKRPEDTLGVMNISTILKVVMVS